MLGMGSRFGRKVTAPPAQAGPAAPVDFRTRFTADLGRMDQLPSMPAVVSRLMEIIQDRNSSMQDLAQALREDPPLTARILRLANSPIYGSGVRVLAVPDAVMRLGMLEVQNLVMSVSLIRTLFTGRRRPSVWTPSAGRPSWRRPAPPPRSPPCC